MTPRRTRDRLPLILGALGLTEHDAAVQTLIGLFGGVPVDVRERVIGEPAVASRRLKFDSGGEIYLHDGGVVAVILHVAPTPGASEGLDLSDWIRGLDNDSTLDEFKRVFGNTWRFGDHGARYFTVDGGYVRRTTKGYPETLLRVRNGAGVR